MKKFLTASVFTVILIFSVSCSVEDDLSLPDDEVGSAVDNETELPDAQIDDSNEFPDTNNNEPDNTPVPDESNLQPDDFDEQPDEPVIPTEMLPNNQWGTSGGDGGKAVRVDSEGSIIVAGIAIGGLDGNLCVKQPDNQCSQDIFVSKWVGGTRIWTKQWGTDEDDYALAVAVDNEGNAIVSGKTKGALPDNSHKGEYDIYVIKFDSDGNMLWTKQYGTDKSEEANRIEIDPTGNIYIGGHSKGSIDGQTNAGNPLMATEDPFVSKFDSNGTKLWTQLRGGNARDVAAGMALDRNGTVFLTGETYGAFPGTVSIGGRDIFLLYFLNQ